jgi:hypothetical protein
MADLALAESYRSSIANTIETIYTSPVNGAGTIITSFTATNNTAANRTYKAYIYGALATPVQAVIPTKIVIRNRYDSGAGIVNQFIPAGGTLRVESDLASSIVFRVSGKEL